LAATPARRDFNERAAALAHELGDPEIVSNSEINLAVNALALGDVPRARRATSIRSAPRSHGPATRGCAGGTRSTRSTRTARIALAERAPERALALADEEAAGARAPSRAQGRGARARAPRRRARRCSSVATRRKSRLADALDLAETIAYPARRVAGARPPRRPGATCRQGGRRRPSRGPPAGRWSPPPRARSMRRTSGATSKPLPKT
jgi:hypothetical protein